MAQRQRQRAVPAHRVAKDADALQVNRQLLRQQRQQLAREVALHAPVRLPRRLGRVQIETRADAKVPAFRLAGDVGTAWAGVGGNQRQTQLRRQALGSGFGHKGFFVASQAGQINQRRHFGALQRLRRQIDRELHRQPNFARMVLVKALRAAKAGVGVLQF